MCDTSYNFTPSVLEDSSTKSLNYMTAYIEKYGCVKGTYHFDDKDKVAWYCFKKIPYAKFPGEVKNSDENRRFLKPQKLDELNLKKVYEKIPDPLNARNNEEIELGESAHVPYNFKKGCCEHKFVNEDQLFVNIYAHKNFYHKTSATPPEPTKPVLVFIPTTNTYMHPGCTKTDFYNAEYFVRQEIVVVVVSYRSGILGFLDTDSPNHGHVANAGLKDIKMALEWIHDKIYVFNGDNENVTLCGHGFGAALVHLCLLNKNTHHLYQRVIMQSGCALNPWVFIQDEKNEMLKKEFLAEHSFEDLQKMPLQDLLLKTQNHAKLSFRNESDLPFFGPTIEKPHEDAFLTAHPLEIMESEDFTFNHQVIIGYNNLEGLALLTDEMISPAENFYMDIAVDGRKKQIPFKRFMKQYGIPPQYRQLGIESNKVTNWLDFITDALFLRGIRATAMRLAEKNPNVYFYKFCCDTKLNFVKGRYPKYRLAGAAHGDELGYIFTIPQNPALKFPEIPTIMSTWATFITYGEPSPATEEFNSLGWPIYDKEREAYLVFGQDYAVENELKSKVITTYKPEKHRMDYWDEMVTENCLSHLTIPEFFAANGKDGEENA